MTITRTITLLPDNITVEELTANTNNDVTRYSSNFFTKEQAVALLKTQTDKYDPIIAAFPAE